MPHSLGQTQIIDVKLNISVPMNRLENKKTPSIWICGMTAPHFYRRKFQIHADTVK